MRIVSTQRWESLEQWSSYLFILGGVFLLVYASHRGMALLIDAISYNEGFYPAILLGRLTALLGIGGLTVGFVNRNPRLGKLSRIVVSVATMITVVFFALATLDSAGFTTPLIGLFGLSTFILSVIAFSLVGIAIVRTGAYSPVIGALLLAVTVTLLALFVGLTVLPAEIMGTVGEGILFALFVSIGYVLQSETAPTDRAEPAPDATAR
jgi:hypothetical protein